MNKARTRNKLTEIESMMNNYGMTEKHLKDTRVLCVIHTHDIHGHIIFWRCRYYYFLGSTLDMQFCFLLLREDASRFANIFSIRRSPWDGSRILLVKHGNIFPIDFNEFLAIHCFSLALTSEWPMDGVVGQLINHIIKWHERVVQSCDCYIRIGCCSPENEASNTTETVNTKRSRHRGLRLLCTSAVGADRELQCLPNRLTACSS